ncbi:MAG: hypothetical protein OXC37_03405, partial [Bdellovibrionaceae bacterium]|nr:hypothetical protein [Pseudobdellovibrionaceae bacterium]
MLKKIFSIFLDILLRVLQIKPILRILKRYKNLIVIFFSTLLLVLIVWLSTFSLSDIFSYKNYLIELTQEQPFLTGSSFFLIYMLISIISIPGITAFSLIGGLLFGLSKGMLICLFAINIGSCIAFLITRYF